MFAIERRRRLSGHSRAQKKNRTNFRERFDKKYRNFPAACSGGPAVAACLGGLCGQGYFCSSNNYCCRCQSGNTTGLFRPNFHGRRSFLSGECVNLQCPTGFLCNTNNYCCPLGSGGVLGKLLVLSLCFPTQLPSILYSYDFLCRTMR